MSASSSMASLSRRLLLSRSLYHSNPNSLLSTRFCTTTTDPTSSDTSDSDSDEPINSDIESDPAQPKPPPDAPKQTRVFRGQILENGLDAGIYRAILLGQVGQVPLQKKLKNGFSVTMFSVGTGGIRNNRRPFANENPTEYANQCAVQWHRVSVYPENLGMIAVKNATVGSLIFLEGNLETKIFTDPITGIIRRIREIAIRRNGRLVFLGNGSDADPTPQGLKGVGYF